MLELKFILQALLGLQREMAPVVFVFSHQGADFRRKSV